MLGKRAYAFEITKALDGQTIWLGNADYNADITTANSGGTLIDTGEGIVTITFGSRNADKTYTTDPTGIASNEDSYTMHADVDTMQNDRKYTTIGGAPAVGICSNTTYLFMPSVLGMKSQIS